MLEVDVRRTRDDVLVLDHDAVRHVAGQETPISAQSYPQWEAYLVETDAPLATLDDAFQIASRAGVGLMLDFKEPGSEALPARAMRRFGFPLDSLLVAGASDTSRRLLRGLDPRIPLSLTLDFENAPPVDAKVLAEVDTDAVTWRNYGLLTAPIVKVLHLRGILVYAWTVDLAEDMRRLRDMGVDGIITTDYPGVLHSL